MRTKPPSTNTTPPSSTTSNRPVKRRKTLSDASNLLPVDILSSPTENAGHQLHSRTFSIDGAAAGMAATSLGSATSSNITFNGSNGNGPAAVGAGSGGVYGNFQNSPTESYGTESARSPIAYGDGTSGGGAGDMDVDASQFGGGDVESSLVRGLISAGGTSNKVNIIGGHEKHVTKRACNECRQQKLRCDVVQNPYTDCSRCRRLKLECRIDSNFKRTVKRSKIAEMEKEVAYLRSLLGMNSSTSSPVVPQNNPFAQTQISQPLLDASASAYGASQTNGLDSQAADQDPDMQLTNLLTGLRADRRDKPVEAPPKDSQTLEDVMLTKEQINELFQIFFAWYHPFLPMLDPSTSPSSYYNASQLLFWTVISVASRRYPGEPGLLLRLSRSVSKLVWSTLATVPHNKNVVKALILLSSWPFPTSSTLTDPTYMLSGLSMSVAIQMGLHRPSYGKDYTKFANKVKMSVENNEIFDRTTTWACCNISAQSVSTGLGLPPDTQYDWTISAALLQDAKYPLPTPLRNLVLIQRFVDSVTRSLNSNNNDPIGLLDHEGRPAVITLLERQLDELEAELNPTLTSLHKIYLLCARLHLRSFYLFDKPNSSSRAGKIVNLYSAASALVSHVLAVEDVHSNILDYCPFYIYQMFTCASFMMLKVLRSPAFNRYLDVATGIKTFNAGLSALRSISVADNDLPGRMADVLTQLWECGGFSGIEKAGSVDGSISAAVSEVKAEEESSVAASLAGIGAGGEIVQPGWDLRIRSRMGMSVVYDSLWKWREQFRERSAYLQAREEVGGAAGSSPDQPNTQLQSQGSAGASQVQTPQAQSTQQQSQTPQPSNQTQTAQAALSLQQQAQSASNAGSAVSRQQSFPVLSNAFQRPATPLLPTSTDLNPGLLATPGPGRSLSSMLPIPTTTSVSGTQSNASAGANGGGSNVGSDVDAMMFGLGGSGVSGVGGGGIGGMGMGDAGFDLNWVLDGFEFLPLPGEAEMEVDGVGAGFAGM